VSTSTSYSPFCPRLLLPPTSLRPMNLLRDEDAGELPVMGMLGFDVAAAAPPLAAVDEQVATVSLLGCRDETNVGGLSE